MPRDPAHLREHALGMLQGGMRTAEVTRAINCNVRTVRCLRQRYRETGLTADHPLSGRPRVTTPAQDRYIRTSHLGTGTGPHQTSTATTLPMGTNPPLLDQTELAKKCSSLMSCGFVSPGVMVGFAFIVKGMSVTPRPVLWGSVSQHHQTEHTLPAGSS